MHMFRLHVIFNLTKAEKRSKPKQTDVCFCKGESADHYISFWPSDRKDPKQADLLCSRHWDSRCCTSASFPQIYFKKLSIQTHINRARWMSSVATHIKLTLCWLQEDKLVWPLMHDILWKPLRTYDGQCQSSIVVTSWVFCVIELPCTL